MPREREEFGALGVCLNAGGSRRDKLHLAPWSGTHWGTQRAVWEGAAAQPGCGWWRRAGKGASRLTAPARECRAVSSTCHPSCGFQDSISLLLEAVRTKNEELAQTWKKSEQWATIEQLCSKKGGSLWEGLSPGRRSLVPWVGGKAVPQSRAAPTALRRGAGWGWGAAEWDQCGVLRFAAAPPGCWPWG